MKNKMVSILIVALLSLWIPTASAEIDQGLDPMVPADVQATVAEEASVSGAAIGQTSNVVSTADVTAPEKKKVEEKKKEKSKKSSKKKSSDSKKKKTSSKSSKKHGTSSN
jgi:hypothetical protein